MGSHRSHITFASIVAVAYVLVGHWFFGIYPEHLLLAAVLVVISGVLPDVDIDNGAPAHEFGGLLAAVAPLVVLEYFPGLKAGGIARIALVVICSYLLTRLFVVRFFKNLTTHRGLVHSLPAALLTFELVYLLFWDLYRRDRLFLGVAASVGFLSHLLVDAYGNLDLVGRAMGKPVKKQPVMKLAGNTVGSTVAMYAGILFLGWFVIRDFYPDLNVYLGIRY